MQVLIYWLAFVMGLAYAVFLFLFFGPGEKWPQILIAALISGIALKQVLDSEY